jgi:cysteine synthase
MDKINFLCYTVLLMPRTIFRPVLHSIEQFGFTELDHRLDDRMRGVLGQYDMGPEQTMAFDLDRPELFRRVEGLVGNTPLIHVEDVGTSHILAKVESQNPTENHYDRIFPQTIKRLEDDGVIEPGTELIEVTSGSGGRSFAWASRVLGYKARIMVPPELPGARVHDMINFSAKLEVTDPGYMEATSKAYVARIRELIQAGLVKPVKTSEYYVFAGTDETGQSVCFVNHSGNELTVEGFDDIGDEIAEQMPDGQGVDFVVSVMGNGTSTTALSRTMKQHYPDVQIVGLEDERSPYYFEQKYPGEFKRRFGRPASFTQHDMYGSSAPGVKLKYGKVDAVDEVRLANPKERDEVRDTYNRGRRNYEKIGNSSAASLIAARQLAIEHPRSTIVVVFYDKVDQYGDSPAIVTTPKFHYDLPRPEGVPPKGWHQKNVGSIALLPHSIRDAYVR